MHKFFIGWHFEQRLDNLLQLGSSDNINLKKNEKKKDLSFFSFLIFKFLFIQLIMN